MEPTIYKPSIYKGAGIYNNGAGGGGSYPELVFRTSDDAKGKGWKFGNLTAKTTGISNCGVDTTIATYALCPYINNAKKIEFSFRIKWENSIGSNYRLYRGNLDVGYQLFVGNIGSDNYLNFFLCYNNNGSSYKTYPNVFRFSANTEYEIYNLLDVENNILKLVINDIVAINDNAIDCTQLNLSRWVPCIGTQSDDLSCTIPAVILIYRDKFSYKLDDVEQIPQETLE